MVLEVMQREYTRSWKAAKIRLQLRIHRSRLGTASERAGSASLWVAKWERCCARLPVRLHQLGHPFGLVKLTAGQKLAHHRLNVYHRRAVDRVQALNVESSAFNG